MGDNGYLKPLLKGRFMVIREMFSLGYVLFSSVLTLKLPLKRGPRYPLSPKIAENAPEVVFVNF